MPAMVRNCSCSQRALRKGPSYLRQGGGLSTQASATAALALGSGGFFDSGTGPQAATAATAITAPANTPPIEHQRASIVSCREDPTPFGKREGVPRAAASASGRLRALLF